MSGTSSAAIGYLAPNAWQKTCNAPTCHHRQINRTSLVVRGPFGAAAQQVGDIVKTEGLMRRGVMGGTQNAAIGGLPAEMISGGNIIMDASLKILTAATDLR